jgi:hypothetical protein
LNDSPDDNDGNVGPRSGGDGAAAQCSLTPSLGFRLLSWLTPALLLAIGVPAIVASGRIPIFAGALTVLGLVLAAVALFDVPSRIEFDGHGVHRVCLLRRQTFAWDDIRALTRPAPRPRLRGRGPADDGNPGIGGADRATGQGGLLVELDSGRRLLLSSGKERLDEYAAIQDVVRAHAPGLAMPGAPWYPQAESGL